MDTLFFAQKAFVVSEGRLLVVQKSSEDPFNPGRWEVPGGRMEFGEDVGPHIIREVFEETGVQISPGRPFHVWQWVLERSDKSRMQVVAVARICSAESEELDFSNRQVDDYLGKAEWVELGNLRDLDWIPNMLPVMENFYREVGFQ